MSHPELTMESLKKAHPDMVKAEMLAKQNPLIFNVPRYWLWTGTRWQFRRWRLKVLCWKVKWAIGDMCLCFAGLCLDIVRVTILLPCIWAVRLAVRIMGGVNRRIGA